jgi:hypothetical protein
MGKLRAGLRLRQEADEFASTSGHAAGWASNRASRQLAGFRCLPARAMQFHQPTASPLGNSVYSSRVQQRARIRAHHRGPLRTAERMLTWAYAAVPLQVPVSGGQGVAGSNPAVPTVFRTLLRNVQQQYSSTEAAASARRAWLCQIRAETINRTGTCAGQSGFRTGLENRRLRLPRFGSWTCHTSQTGP